MSWNRNPHLRARREMGQSELRAFAPISAHHCYDLNLRYLECKSKDENPATCQREAESVLECDTQIHTRFARISPEKLEKSISCFDYAPFYSDCFGKLQEWVDDCSRETGISYWKEWTNRSKLDE